MATTRKTPSAKTTAFKKKIAKRPSRAKAEPKKADPVIKAKKPAALSLYKDLIQVARDGIKAFIAVAKLGNKHGWRDPGPAQWDLPKAVDFLGGLSTVPGGDEKLIITIQQANEMFVAVLIDGYRKGRSYRKTNKVALENLRAFYSAHIRPELLRYQAEEKARIKAEAKAAKVAA